MFDHRHLAAALESVSSVPAEPIAPEPGNEQPVRQGPRTVRTARSSDPRRRILDAMIETVAQRGYDRTTLERVQGVAKVPAPVFDEHFEDKQDCFLQAIDEFVGKLECMVLERLRRPAPWPERIRLGLETLLEALAENPDGARVAMVECLSAGKAPVARLHSALASFVPILEEGRTLARSTEHLPPQTSAAVVGGIASIVHRRALEGNTAELPLLLPDLLYFALMPYLGHRRALIAAGPGVGA
jgi:AcrR family transcriptional regulator